MKVTQIMSSSLDQAIIKAYWRLMPLLFISSIFSSIDRNNISLGKLKMVNDLPAFRNHSETIFGLGHALFFVGYLLFGIPATVIVEKWSVRKLICLIMIVWGVLASLTAFVTQPWHFYVLRFLLGLAESGFFPSTIIYLARWFPVKARARAISLFLISGPIAQLIMPKVSYVFLRMGTTEDGIVYNTLLELRGWQWMFIAWGLPSILLGFLVLLFLTDRPGEADWLTSEQRHALESQLATKQMRCDDRLSLFQGICHVKVFLFGIVHFFALTSNIAFDLFLPTVLNDWYYPSNDVLTWLLVIPPLCGLFGMLLLGWSSDQTGERYFHTAAPLLLATLTLGLSMIRQYSLAVTMFFFATASVGLKSYHIPFWSLSSLLLTSETISAGSIGLINSIGNLGGCIGPLMVGILKDRTGSFFPGIFALTFSTGLAAGIIIIVFLRFDRPTKYRALSARDSTTETI